MYILEVYFNKKHKRPRIICPYEEKFIKFYKEKGYVLKKKEVKL